MLNYKDVKIPQFIPINEDGSFSVNIIADVYVFKPKIGSNLKGMMFCVIFFVSFITFFFQLIDLKFVYFIVKNFSY